jgi:hypothetical protein
MGLKEYEKEKTKLVKEKNEVLEGEFDKKKKENTAQRRINKSSKINESRMKKMNIRQEYPPSYLATFPNSSSTLRRPWPTRSAETRSVTNPS